MSQVGAFPFKMPMPEDAYPTKPPKPYMELYQDRWWFLRILAHPQHVTRFGRQLWPNLFMVFMMNVVRCVRLWPLWGRARVSSTSLACPASGTCRSRC